MISRKWQFTLDGISHEVSLTFSLFHQYKAQVDGKVIFEKSVYKTRGTYQTLDFPGHEVVLGVIPGAFTNEAYLRVDDEIIPLLGNGKKKIGGETIGRFDKLENWKNFSQELGFAFFTRPEIDPASQFRLAGYFSNLLVIIIPALRQYQKVTLPGILVTIRHAPLSQEEILALSKSEDLRQFQKKVKIAKDDYRISADSTALFIQDTGKSAMTRQSQIIREFLSLMARHLKAPLDVCDGVECKKIDSSRHLVLINATSYVMCSDCISNIKEFGEKRKTEYEKQPTNLKMSILKGSLTGLLCAIAGGLAITFFPKIAFGLWNSMAVLVVFVLITNSMVKALNKWSIFSMIASIIITEISVFLGILFGGLGEMIFSQKIGFSWNDILDPILKNPNLAKILSMNIVYIIFLFIPFIIVNSINNRNAVSRTFSPEVEVLTELPIK